MPKQFLAAIVAFACLIGVAQRSRAQDPVEIFDAHLHYNWEPQPYLNLDDVTALFKKNGVTGILATSRPNTGTHALVEAKTPGFWVVPFIRPYRVRADITSWMGDPTIYELVKEEHKRGGYRGVGEFHLSGKAASNQWVKRIVDFAADNSLFLHCHCDAEALEILYVHSPKSRIIWAHTGFSLEPERVGALLDKYPELWGELSYRGGITDGSGKLTPVWRALLERHPTRFLLGSDTWISERWASYDSIISGYRQWLAQLPPDVARQIANGNAKALFAGK
jgi:Amidohydrolase